MPMVMTMISAVRRERQSARTARKMRGVRGTSQATVGLTGAASTCHRFVAISSPTFRPAARVPGSVSPSDPEILEVAERKRKNALARLYAWHREWSEIARVSIRRRDQLIRLGLAYRKTGAPAEDDADAALDGDAASPSTASATS
jgi:hypothetical protein